MRSASGQMLHTLYRFFDHDGALLYVGITANPWARWKQHGSTKSWWNDVATITVENFGDKEGAAVAERQAITTEHPRYNVRDNETYLDAAESVKAWIATLIANGGENVPEYGSEAWVALPDDSRAKVAATVLAAEAWAIEVAAARGRVGTLMRAVMLRQYTEPALLASLADAIDEYLDMTGPTEMSDDLH